MLLRMLISRNVVHVLWSNGIEDSYHLLATGILLNLLCSLIMKLLRLILCLETLECLHIIRIGLLLEAHLGRIS